jgi:DNA-binding response OmpR family regulator
MNTDIISLRVLLVTPAPSLRGLLRQGVAQASVPAEVMEANGVVAAEALISRGSDLLFLDSGMSKSEKTAICNAARAAKQRPFIIAIGRDAGAGVEIDGSVRRPATAEEASMIADSCIRSRRPTRVLMVDDSSTMRGIVRKILSASKFPLEVAESHDGVKALQDVRERNFDIVFLDYNMPGSDGFEILSELRRLQSRVVVVMMTSTDDAAVAERAHMAGAAAFLRKPFFPGCRCAALPALRDRRARARGLKPRHFHFSI